MEQEQNKISQMDAFLIETVRANGVSNEEIWQRVKEGNVNGWENFHSKFDFTGLIELYQRDQELFSSILNDGYSLKFVTIKGIQRLLKLKFDFETGADYQLTEDGLVNMTVTIEQLAEIKKMLSANWMVNIDLGSGNICILQSKVLKQ